MFPSANLSSLRRGVCEDNAYWDEYKSYKVEFWGVVLAGPGLDWSHR